MKEKNCTLGGDEAKCGMATFGTCAKCCYGVLTIFLCFVFSALGMDSPIVSMRDLPLTVVHDREFIISKRSESHLARDLICGTFSKILINWLQSVPNVFLLLEAHASSK